ncbi:unnamed protein product [Protopolystoma xenopodis]|uniref:LRRCT domain-containing protein n=1 Tax=Protopolystoma xenopodis TaxID=117903 RepID=A0A3S5AFX2_9PLAT|nr:unnamed protein product [Protopolystoma xenopodis]
MVDNPLNCGCRLKWLQRLLVHTEAGDNQWARCAQPTRLSGQLIRELTDEQMQCIEESSDGRKVFPKIGFEY